MTIMGVIEHLFGGWHAEESANADALMSRVAWYSAALATCTVYQRAPRSQPVVADASMTIMGVIEHPFEGLWHAEEIQILVSRVA